MAFKDENGKITIDEIAAQKDIQKLTAAKECLLNAEKYLREISAISMEFSGNSQKMIFESSQLFQSKIALLNRNIDECNSTIKSTINKYQLIDSKLKDVINSSINNEQ